MLLVVIQRPKTRSYVCILSDDIILNETTNVIILHTSNRSFVRSFVLLIISVSGRKWKE